ncbi:MAG: SprT-like domain-containing protein [Gammaproteobacteria bacterium]
MSETVIKPINEQQQSKVILQTEHFIRLAEKRYDCQLPRIPLQFNLKGRASGMYVVRHTERYFRFNPYLFAKYFDEALLSTIPHEVAHYVTDVLYGLNNIKPHGIEWQSVMRDFGVEPRVTGRYDLTGVPVRRQRRFSYSCACMSHQVSSSRHNKIRTGKTAYFCRKCGDPIVPAK